jgi:uncharacterized protein YbaP (TraB family)
MAAFLLSRGVIASDGQTAIFWSISKDGRPAGYLLGTIHSEDPRVLDFPDEFLQKLASNQIFAMEMVPDINTLSQLTQFMMYQDGKTLEEQVGAERYSKIRTALSQYKVPSDWILNMKVWATVMTLSVPPPETGFFMDFSLSLRASGSGLRVVGLETLDQQLSFLENMPMNQQLDLLDQALLEHDQVREVHNRLVDTYLEGDLQALQSESDTQLQQLDPASRDYFVEQGIDARNQRMLQSLLPLLKEGSVFIAVGALHLPGEYGLVALLGENGYHLQAEALPFGKAKP